MDRGNRSNIQQKFLLIRNSAMKRQLGVLAAVTLFLAADKPKDEAVKKELDKIQGSWTIISSEKDGKPEESRKNVKVVFTGDQFVRTSKENTLKGSVALNPAVKPMWMDTTFVEGPDKKKTFLGIYALEGDTLKICFADEGKQRPTEFATKAGGGLSLVVMNRDKPTPAPAKPPATPPPPPPPPPPAKPPIPDKNLEAAVREVLHEPKGDLTDEKLKNLFVLKSSGKKIASLAGLEKCKNLAELKLSNNQITDVAPLRDCTNLQSLDLAGNQISDLTPLAGLTKLQYLELSNNQIKNLAPLKGLTNLTALYLSGNKISDIGPVGSLVKLWSLSLEKNQIRNLAPLATVTRISTLNLNDNQVDNLGPLTKQTELGMLIIEGNKITDLTPLVTMSKADAGGPKRFAPFLRVYLKGNPLSEEARTRQMSALKGYGVRFESH
jgi:uncharacterized protein (TIGR03067 family)